MTLKYLLPLVLALLFKTAAPAGFQQVTCGSVLKIANVDSSDRLHSHDVKYGSGSGQQTVTGVPHADDVNSYWLVKGAYGVDTNYQRGASVQCGSVIRLQHVQTRKFLHSHRFKSPLSGNQEVSAFGGDDSSDSGDNWEVECSSSQAQYWQRDENVRLKHVDTNAYLHITGHKYGRPISGQKEVSGISTKSSSNLWRAMEGVYLDSEKVA
ncbi:Stromal cell-derived factor 2 [Geodia barretti]|uniref:Stromal cell-derived factor 2 n=1 Tax=Geodia barretti TaxID=519541 RepID=A0AA35XEC4_GEOBA|nr:Stromal cell-derived factor 2 [Geodia barretti]